MHSGGGPFREGCRTRRRPESSRRRACVRKKCETLPTTAIVMSDTPRCDNLPSLTRPTGHPKAPPGKNPRPHQMARHRTRLSVSSSCTPTHTADNPDRPSPSSSPSSTSRAPSKTPSTPRTPIAAPRTSRPSSAKNANANAPSGNADDSCGRSGNGTWT